MSALGIGLFWVSALLAVAGALGTVAAKSAIRSAMSLLLSILGIAGLYVTLSAQLLAAVQVIVYAGAVVVLFVFVIMLVGGSGAESGSGDDTRRTRAIGTALFALVSAGALVLVGRAGIGGPHVFERPRAEFGSVYEVGRALFTDGVFAFELVGVLLLVAIVGVMAIARTRRPAPLAEAAPKQEEPAS